MVYAINAQREPQLSDQKNIIEEAITKLRLPIADIKYETIASGTRAIGKGEVFVDSRTSPPIIWVEDEPHAYTSRPSRPKAGPSK